MDIKDLNKSQLLLLAILLSFITSIATGITTVALMQQAPESVTVPINRVIQQTVEKIQQVEGKTTVQTVVVKEEDLVVEAIDQNKSMIFSISKDSDSLGVANSESWAGRGFLVASGGIIVADAVLAGEDKNYFISGPSGKFKAEYLYSDPKGFSFLKIANPLDETSKVPTTLPAFGDLASMKIGQKIIVLGSTISSFIFEGDSNIKINLVKSNAGGTVLNLEGEVLGIALYNEVTPFAPINSITESLKTNASKLD
jgi:S1-C subfamily serine protease